jgi:hypothetical protein
LTLVIAPVFRAVQAAVAQIDPAREGDVKLGPARMTQHYELLMMGSSWAYPHISDALAAGRLYLLTEMAILLLTERKLVQVRTPEQALDRHPASSGGRELV